MDDVHGAADSSGSESNGGSSTDQHGRQVSAQPLLSSVAEAASLPPPSPPSPQPMVESPSRTYTARTSTSRQQQQHQQQQQQSLHSSTTPRSQSTRSMSHEQFMEIVEEVRLAINAGIQPQRIQQGSSGSYFCRNRQGRIVGVFKPKNEEPYGKLNPKWTKWLHKTCCPCCFGRSCLIPNLGYISEASASVVDRHLSLNIVPRTEVVSLASPAFYYSYIDRSHARRHAGLYPPKIGSFQIFMHGYMDATKFLREGPAMLRDGRLPRDPTTGSLDHALQRQFQADFERLVVLDYIIRNTDRGLDNWMVRYDEANMEEVVVARHNNNNDHDMPVLIDTSADDVAVTASVTSGLGPASPVLSVKDHGGASYDVASRTFDARTMASTDAVKSVAEAASIMSGGGAVHTRTTATSSINMDSRSVAVSFAAGNTAAQPSSPYAEASSAAIASAGALGSSGSAGTSRNRLTPSHTVTHTLSDKAADEPQDDLNDDVVLVSAPSLRLAAIDNGLAFPFKHPDQWRSYPYGWSSLPAARVPFSMETRDRLLPLLTSRRWWEELTGDLRAVFEMDVDFDEILFRRQIAVMKGQVYNLVHILRAGIYVDGRTPTVPTVTSSPRSAGSDHAAAMEPDSALLHSATDPSRPADISSGTPLDLVRQSPCLVWEDADVRDLVGGEFGRDLISRDGFLGTIIGMDSAGHGVTGSVHGNAAGGPPLDSPAPGLPAVNEMTKLPKKRVRLESGPMDGDAEMGARVSSAGSGSNGDQQRHIGEFLTSPSSIREPDSETQRRRRSLISASEITHNIDAFRGRVVTFVRGQPWFSNW